MNEIARIKDICLRMEDMCAEGGIPPFDRVRLVSDPGKPDEVWFLWEERKLAVAVELTAGPKQLSTALAQATAGDPVLN